MTRRKAVAILTGDGMDEGPDEDTDEDTDENITEDRGDVQAEFRLCEM